MASYVITVMPDESGVPQARTYCVTEEGTILAVIAVLENPEPPRRVRVVAEGYINIRSGPGVGYTDVSNALNGETYPVLAEQADPVGNAWAQIGINPAWWICRVYGGVVKAEFV